MHYVSYLLETMGTYRVEFNRNLAPAHFEVHNTSHQLYAKCDVKLSIESLFRIYCYILKKYMLLLIASFACYRAT